MVWRQLNLLILFTFFADHCGNCFQKYASGFTLLSASSRPNPHSCLYTSPLDRFEKMGNMVDRSATNAICISPAPDSLPTL